MPNIVVTYGAPSPARASAATENVLGRRTSDVADSCEATADAHICRRWCAAAGQSSSLRVSGWTAASLPVSCRSSEPDIADHEGVGLEA
jgi:hypothetical protein